MTNSHSTADNKEDPRTALEQSQAGFGKLPETDEDVHRIIEMVKRRRQKIAPDDGKGEHGF